MRPAIVTLLVGALAVTFAPDARADARAEGAAKAAIKKAASDYAALNYGTGANRILKALKVCGVARCSTVIRGSLLMDLGAMQYKKGDKDLATKSWTDAAKLQPGIGFDPAFDAPDLRAAFAAATAAATGGGGGGGQAPTGDFTHTPPTEQATNTPLPLYVEGGGDSVTRVVVKYRGESSMSWKRVDMKKIGSGWGALIPCGDVSSGTLRYYVQGLDESKTPIASNGDTKHPYTVQIKDSISGAAPHLPGKSAPKSCSVSSDCPPDFPGCAKSGESAGEEGEENGDQESNKEEEKPSGPFKRFWVGIGTELEFLSVPGGSDLCQLDPNSALPTNKNNMYCTTLDDHDFPIRATPVQNAALCTPNSPPGTCPGDGGGGTSGGLVRGDLRVFASFDYAITANLLGGARAGASIFTYPGQAAGSDGRLPSFVSRFYGELRGTWIFGEQALASTGLKPMVFAGVGVASFEGHKSGFVGLCGPNGANVSGGVSQNSSGTAIKPVGTQTQPGGQCANPNGVDATPMHLNNYVAPTTGTVNIWGLDGPLFVLVGAGGRWAVTDSIAITGALRLNAAFGTSGLLPTFGPELGVQYGF